MNLPKNKHLVIFDFDETLCQTNGLIKRLDKKQKDTKPDFLTPGQYSAWRETGEYDLQPSRWELDFSEFQGFPTKGQEIPETMTKLRDCLDDNHYLCALVTGRDELSGPKEFLIQNYIEVDKMILLCSGDPNKTSCFESLMNTLNPSSVTIYEDNIASINQCEGVCAKYRIPCASVLIGSGQIKWNWRTRRGN